MKTGYHSFNIHDAKEYGVECAVILQNFRFWLDKNKANNRNIKDGRVWTYNKIKAFTIMFPYLSKDQVKRRLEKLRKAGKIVVSNYNEHQYDRTNWYSVDESEYRELRDEQNRTEQNAKSPNGKSETATPIPDNKPVSIPDEGEENKKPSPNKGKHSLSTWESNNGALSREHVKEFLDKYRLQISDTELTYEIDRFRDKFSEKHYKDWLKTFRNYLRARYLDKEHFDYKKQKTETTMQYKEIQGYE